MKKITMRYMLLFISLLGCFHVQAKWVEIPYDGQFTLKGGIFDIGSKDNIWAVASKRVQENMHKKEGLQKSDFYLVKWDAREKKWIQHAIVGQQVSDFYRGKIAAAPDGSVFVLKSRRFMKKSQAQLDDAIAKAVALAGRRELEKLVSEGKVAKSLFDLLVFHWHSGLKKFGVGHPAWANFVSSPAFQNQTEDVKHQINKVTEKVEQQIRKLYQRPTRPLLRFADGVQKVIDDLGREKADVEGIAAINKDQLLLLKSTRKLIKNKKGQPELQVTTWVEKWDGSSYERMGKEVQDVSQISVGADGSVYLSGVVMWVTKSQFTFTLLKWDGSTWKSVDLKTKKIPLDLAIISSDDIWFHIDYPMGVKFYRWNGKIVEKRGMIKAPPNKMAFPAKMGAAPGIVLAIVPFNGDARMYKWVEERKVKVGLKPFVPPLLLRKK